VLLRVESWGEYKGRRIRRWDGGERGVGNVVSRW
jgi:hypothetical protein